MKSKKKYLKKLAAWLMPYTCLFCHNLSDRAQDLCTACLKDLPIIDHPCKCCAKPLSSMLDLICGHCLMHPSFFDRTLALFAYKPPITRFIMQLKFNHALLNARVAGELLADKILTEWYVEQPLPDLIIPVPLHVKRLKERGFNQAVEIARPLANKLHLPLDLFSVQRVKSTAAQATLLAKERWHNVQNAFAVEKNFTNMHVAVVDDVITTGNTIQEFCRILKKSGVRQIDVWCSARALNAFTQ